MFAKHISDKGLIFKICEEFYKSIEKHKQSNVQMGREINRHFSKRTHKNDQQIPVKMLILSNHHGNAKPKSQ